MQYSTLIMACSVELESPIWLLQEILMRATVRSVLGLYQSGLDDTVCRAVMATIDLIGLMDPDA